MKEQGEILALSVENSARVLLKRGLLSDAELISLFIGGALLRMVSPMRLSRAIEEGRKKFESFTTEGESNQEKTRG